MEATLSCYPVTMKKNRPGIKVEVLCPPEKKDAITQCLFAETSTLSVRYQRVHRHILNRSLSTVVTSFGEVQVKCTTDNQGYKRYAPEYEACRKTALEKGVPLQKIYDAVAKAVHDGYANEKRILR